MADEHPKNPNPNLPSSSTNNPKPVEAKTGGGYSGRSNTQYPHPPDPTNPDPATLRDQWRYAVRQYSKWYSHAWGTAILAGLSFYALGWIIKGSNPLPIKNHNQNQNQNDDDDDDDDDPGGPHKQSG